MSPKVTKIDVVRNYKTSRREKTCYTYTKCPLADDKWPQEHFSDPRLKHQPVFSDTWWPEVETHPLVPQQTLNF